MGGGRSGGNGLLRRFSFDARKNYFLLLFGKDD